MPKPTTRPHRLHKNLYQGKTCSFTCCIQDKESIFVEKNIAQQKNKLLLEAANKHECEIVIALFMPDHLHAIIQATTHRSNPLTVIRLFKQTSGYWMSKNNIKARWQKGFYDHILRKDEDVTKHVIYILGNPVRAGLVENWKQFPLKSSTIFNLDSLET